MSIKREKFFDRDMFTYEEKVEIAKKSDNRCCHCGKECYINFGATVDHFVPLSKGGTNRPYNLIMLCEDCNKEKNNRIIDPENYLKYLHEEDKRKLTDYFESYLQSFEFIDRTTLLACDEYELLIYPPMPFNIKHMKKKNKHAFKGLIYYLRKAICSDEDRIIAFFTECLKKHNKLDSERSAALNIKFWMRFGCIYYIEKNDEIIGMVCITMQETRGRIAEDGVNKTLVMLCMSKYSTKSSINTMEILARVIPNYIMGEQKLTQIPVNIQFLAGDSAGYQVLDNLSRKVYMAADVAEVFIIATNKKMKPTTVPYKDETLVKFFSKFKDVENEIDKWIIDNNAKDISWMKDEIIYYRHEDVGKEIRRMMHEGRHKSIKR